MAGHRIRDWWWVRPGLWKRERENLWIEYDRDEMVYIVHGLYRGSQAPDITCGFHIQDAMDVAESWMRHQDAGAVAPSFAPATLDDRPAPRPSRA